MGDDDEIFSEFRAWIASHVAPNATSTSDPTIVAVVQTTHAQRVLDTIVDANVEPVVVSMQGTKTDLVTAAKMPVSVTFRRKMIVALEYDAMLSSDAALASAVNAAVKVNVTPVVIVASAFKTKRTELPKNHAFFEIDPPPVGRCDKGLTGAVNALAGKVIQYRGDGIAIGAVFDNYPGAAASDDDAFAIAETFSVSDVVEEGLCRSGSYDNNPFSFLPVAEASLRCAAIEPEVETFGTIWSKTNAMYAKLKTLRTVQQTHPDARVIDGIDVVRGIVLAMLTRGSAPDEIARVVAGMRLEPVDLLTIMRLWKCKYPLSTHIKIKKSAVWDTT